MEPRRSAIENWDNMAKIFDLRSAGENQALETELQNARPDEAPTEYEIRFNDLVEGSLQGVMVTQDKKIIFANNALSTILGFTVNELERLESWEQLVAPADRERVLGYCRARNDGRAAPNRYEYQALRKDGSVIWLENLSHVVRWDGQPATQATIVDITLRKLSEERLQRSETKHKEFASNVAHELLTPLSHLSIRLNNPDKFGDIADMRGDVEYMSLLIDQFLMLAKLEHFDLDTCCTMDLYDLCAEVAAKWTPFMIDEKIEVKVEGRKGRAIVNGNRECLKKVIENLLENAAKHSNKCGTITVDIGETGTVSVIDSGRGVPFERRETIFQRLMRGDTKSNGTGLGLYIVKQIVDAHRGSITLRDTPGGGATFTVDLKNSRLKN